MPVRGTSSRRRAPAVGACKRGPGSELFQYEAQVAGGAAMVVGVDEAGRGPLAGPVVGCAVALESCEELGSLADSKRLSAAQREMLFDAVLRHSKAVSWVSVSEEVIDRLNILRASLLAMTFAVERLPLKPDLVLVDGPYRLSLDCEQRAIVGADGLSASVAAASIVAKVVRDRVMAALDEVYPAYGFGSNKGYPTKFHIEALRRHGPCPAHRMSFEPVRLCARSDEGRSR